MESQIISNEVIDDEKMEESGKITVKPLIEHDERIEKLI